MALTIAVSQKELQRIASLSYEGKTLKVMLCNIGVNSYNSQTNISTWQTIELSGNGYVRYSEIITTGTYNTTSGRYELPSINAQFSASGAGYSYDRVVLYIDGESFPHSVITESPNITLVAGQTQTYRLSLNTDD